MGISSHLLKEIEVTGEKKTVFVCQGFNAKQLENLETESPETIRLELMIVKKKLYFSFLLIYITVNSLLGKYLKLKPIAYIVAYNSLRLVQTHQITRLMLGRLYP